VEQRCGRCYDRDRASTERFPPLHSSDPRYDDPQADLPLRDDSSPPLDDRRIEAEPLPVARELFPRESGPQFATESPGGGSGVRTWFVAAAALVVGILIGFFSGYRAARVSAPAVAVESAAVPEPEPAQPTRVETPAEKTFSEAAVPPPAPVAEPTPPPVVRPTSPPASNPPVGRRAGAAARTAAGAAPARATQRATPVRSAQREPQAPAVDPSAPGSLQVLSRPSGAEVVLDGRTVGRTPLVLPEVRNGMHDVRIELPGFRRWVTSVDVAAGTRTRVAASLEQ
jgi:hypothetical protein